MIKQFFLLAITVLLLSVTTVFAQTISIQQQGRSTSIRGLSVVNDNVAWISGSKGHVALTTDGGKSWGWQQVKGFEKADFRDIEAFSEKDAVIMSSGSPAVILKTIDGGLTWKEKYRKTDSVYFLDAMDFADSKHGFILGDPIDGKFLLLETKNAGESWAPVVNPPVALANEAAFAASGTCIRVTTKNINIVTGGSNSRMFKANTSKMVWATTLLPLTNNNPSRGAFSFATGKEETIAVGGNYSKNKLTDSVAYVMPSARSKQKAMIPTVGPAGYQSCVEYLNGKTYLSTGTPGSNLTTDGGATWRQIDTTSFNVCRKAKRGSLILLAGDAGKIAILKL